MNNDNMKPIIMLLKPMDALLNMNFCNYIKGCGTNCSCRKIGIECSIFLDIAVVNHA